MGQLFKAIYAYRQSVLIIIVLISTLVACSFTFRYKVKEIILNEIRATIISSSQDELFLVNQKFKSVIDILRMAQNALSEDQFIGSINTTQVLDSVVSVTGFVYLGIADINGNTAFGFSLSPKEFEHILPAFHGEPLITYVDNGDNYDVIIAVPFSKYTSMKYVLYVRVTDKELVNYLNQGRTHFEEDSPVMSFLLYDMKNIIHINNSTQTRKLPNYTVDVIKQIYKETDEDKLEHIIEQNPRGIYAFNVDGYPKHYMVVMVAAYDGLNFVTLMPADMFNARVNAIMALFTILAVGVILVVAFLLIYYEFVVNMNRKSIYKLAFVDEFTGLPNKASLRQKFEFYKKHISENQKLYLAKLDIHNRGQIARLYGHDIANNVDLSVANYVKKNHVPYFYVARVNEFFVALVVSRNYEHAEKLITSAFENMEQVDQVELKAIFNCGIVEVDPDNEPELGHSDQIDYLIDCCNMAMSMAPLNLRDHHIELFDKDISNEILRRDTIEKDLTPALANGEFLVYLQPKYDLKTNRLAGAEALIRWDYKKQGIIAPYKFIPVFEKNGSIALIDNFVLSEVLQLLRKWNREKLRLVPISVNLSQVQFLNPNLISDFKTRAAHYETEFKYIDFEITESATIEDFRHVVEVLTELKELGVKLSMDDFGTGYSSLSNLSLLPFDTIKLDKSFVDRIDYKNLDSPSVLLIQDVINIISHFNMSSLVEGVETIEQRDILRDLGCQYCQGYYYSKPLPVEEFEKLLREDKVFTDVASAQDGTDLRVQVSATKEAVLQAAHDAVDKRYLHNDEKNNESKEKQENKEQNCANNDKKPALKEESSVKTELEVLSSSDTSLQYTTLGKGSVISRNIVEKKVSTALVKPNNKIEVVDITKGEQKTVSPTLRQEVKEFKLDNLKDKNVVEVLIVTDKETSNTQKNTKDKS